jgi:hypothetical protein
VISAHKELLYVKFLRNLDLASSASVSWPDHRRLADRLYVLRVYGGNGLFAHHIHRNRDETNQNVDKGYHTFLKLSQRRHTKMIAVQRRAD